MIGSMVTRGRLALSVCLTAVAVATCASAPAGPTAESFHSAALGRTMHYRIMVPENVRNARVLYLLHGYGGDQGDWFTYSRVAEEAARHGLVVVTPDGANSWYVNSAIGRWEDYIVTDLVEEVERRWPVAKGRDARAIAGLSMGGYGAVRIGLRHPERFALAASMSGALDITRFRSVFNPRGERPDVFEIFGPADSRTRQDNDVYRLADAAPASALPYLYVDCGVDDPWFGVNREFAGILRARQLAHEFHEEPGSHNWAYWDRQVRVVVALAAQRLR